MGSINSREIAKEVLGLRMDPGEEEEKEDGQFHMTSFSLGSTSLSSRGLARSFQNVKEEIKTIAEGFMGCEVSNKLLSLCEARISERKFVYDQTGYD